MSILDIHLYKNMLLIRLAEEEIAKRYKSGKMRCPPHSSIGQEASATGVGLALKNTDLAVSTHRAHAHYLAKGGNLKRMIAEIYGKATGCCKGKGGSMHLIDRSVGFEGSTAIVGNTIPIGVGLGLSLKLDSKNAVSVIYCGDGSVEEGVFYESVNFAVTKKLPVLFVCENNSYSVYSPLKVRQPKGRKIHFQFRSQDVLHSAYMPHFRAQMNCVPGMVTKFGFTPKFTTEEMRQSSEVIAKTIGINKIRKAKGEEELYEFNFILLCNKICGASHYNMQMKITVVDQEDYDEWIAEQPTLASILNN